MAQDGRVERLTIFAKGNGDVRDSLHALIEDGALRWNGINAILGETHPGWRARVTHETLARSDALLRAEGVPAILAERSLPLGPYGADRQFATRLFTEPADAIILSIQADVMNRPVAHRDDGHLFYPHDLDIWPDADRQWLIDQYRPVPPLTPEQSMAALAAIIARLRTRGDPAILIYNLSPIMPWEWLHCHVGIGETLATRIRRFNLALIDLSRTTGISIVDVDSLVARAGADRIKRDAVALSAEGCRLVAGEVVRILADLGRLPETHG